MRVIGRKVRSNHRYAFRSGQWATVFEEGEFQGRWCWWVRFEDGAEDVWVAEDPLGNYEIA